MSFILKIFFSGLMIFTPSSDGNEMTVVLLAAGPSHYLSDGSALHQHKSILVARAGACSGDCPARDSDVAQFLYADQSPATAQDSIEAAVGGGGAWLLSNSDLSLQKASSSDPALPALSIVNNARTQSSIIPSTSSQREDISWIADLKQLCGSSCTLDSSVLGSAPPSTVVARFHLRTGRVFTQSIARIGANVTPVHFSRLDGSGSASSYSQAIATWVGAEIEVSGSGIEIVESKFNGDPGRTMTLTPDANHTMEIAVLDLPPFVPPASSNNDAPQVGKHFEAYYDLLASPPAKETRLVPRAGALSGAQYSTVDWSTVHPTSAVYSTLLNSLRLDVGRAAYNRLLCPPAIIEP
ncbi:MAG TPA: hypothetical protein VJZ76_07535 [Thermoanaerobaculia bacterium]|nr:hypothetical protein [Thermoanaerobaculia bacterium]